MTITTPSYRVSIASLAGHLVNVALDIPSSHSQGLRLSLPAWIPGSYMIRDFAKHIVRFTAVNARGETHGFEKIDKQTWKLAPNQEPLRIEYQVYAFDLSVRGAFLNDQYGFFNGTSVFLRIEGCEDLPHRVSFDMNLPECKDWSIATSLPVSGQHYSADSYAELIDHPILIGHFDQVAFTTRGTKFTMVFAGGHFANLKRLAADTQRLCEHHFDLFGRNIELPNYLFLTMMTDNQFGGLEHKFSTALMYPRDDLITPTNDGDISDGYRDFLALASHEFFHTWHVKRTRPKALLKPDLGVEVYTPQLWIYEGFTSLYDDISLPRAGLTSLENYLEVVGKQLTRLQRNRGRFKQSAAESSFDAWTRFYQQDESAQNNIVSYYNKGAIIALCLDLSLRQSASTSLDAVMQYLWNHYGLDERGTEDEVINHILTQLGAADLIPQLQRWVHGTEELPYQQLLQEHGVKVCYRSQSGPKDMGGKAADTVVKHLLGFRFKTQGSGLLVQTVAEQSDAYFAGLHKGDVVIGIDGWQVTASRLQTIADRLETGVAVDLVVLRDSRVLTLALTPTPAPRDTIYLEVVDRDKAERWIFGH